MTDSEYELLQSDTAQLIAEEVKGLEERDAASTSPKSEQRSKLSLEGVGNKIKTFIAKSFAKTSTHHIAAQLKTKLCNDSKVESRQYSHWLRLLTLCF